MNIEKNKKANLRLRLSILCSTLSQSSLVTSINRPKIIIDLILLKAGF